MGRELGRRHTREDELVGGWRVGGKWPPDGGHWAEGDISGYWRNQEKNFKEEGKVNSVKQCREKLFTGLVTGREVPGDLLEQSWWVVQEEASAAEWPRMSGKEVQWTFWTFSFSAPWADFFLCFQSRERKKHVLGNYWKPVYCVSLTMTCPMVEVWSSFCRQREEDVRGLFISPRPTVGK